MSKDPVALAAGVMVAITIVIMAGYAAIKLAHAAPARMVRALLALTALLGVIPAILLALYSTQG